MSNLKFPKEYNAGIEPTPDEALLTAYLDGELSSQDRQRLEQRLAHEPKLRQQLTILEETWHYLDLLEQEGTDTEQVETTLKTAAVSLLDSPIVPMRMGWCIKWGTAILIGMVLFTGSFQFGGQFYLDDPFFRRMIERVDMYRAISDDGLDLLRRLTNERVFLPPLPQDMPPMDPHEYEPHAHFYWTFAAFVNPVIYDRNDIDETEWSQLFYKNIQKFHILSPEKKKQILKLHRDIEGTPGRVELVLTLQNYYHWLKSLQAYERNDLNRSTSTEEKAAGIIALKKHLDERQLDDAVSMPSEIIGMEENKNLAKALAELPPWRQERLLNIEPIQIINELKRTVW